MALVPKIKFCITNKCDKVNLYEETSPYTVTNNTGGWGTPNPDTASITDAVVNIYDYTGNSLLESIPFFNATTDVYSGVAGAPTPGAFLAVSNYSWTQTDGIFKVEYLVTVDPGVLYTNETQRVLFICNLENCLHSLKAKAVTECDSKSLSKLKDKIDQIELIIYGIKSAFSCGDFTTANSLIESGKKICDNLCDCGCGDC